MINIAGLTPVEDPSYRYKMPRIQAKVEGRGNGIKTVLVNVGDLGTALNRDAPEITKFFGCEIGSQTSYSADTERAIVNGAHNAPDLQNHLSKYIENFVLCKNCRYPETHYKIKGGIIYQKCLACGSKDSCDMQHKLTTFILAQYKKAKDADGKKDKKEKKKVCLYLCVGVHWCGYLYHT
jgi:translation initiation factor 5